MAQVCPSALAQLIYYLLIEITDTRPKQDHPQSRFYEHL